MNSISNEKKRKNIVESKGNKVYIRFELIGYKNSGEGIIISIINENNEVSWCGVVDCFSFHGKNKTKDILKSYNYGEKRKINFLCITHPDQDHIFKISEIIENYTDNNTMFVLPDFFNSNISQTKEIIKIRETLNKQFDYDSRTDSLKNNLFFNRTLKEPALKWTIVSGTSSCPLQIESITPFDTIMYTSKKVEYTKFKNDFSIALRITLKDSIYFLMGDCSEYILAHIDESEFYGKTQYLKIPHHADKNIIMENLIKDEIIDPLTVATCTYRKNTTLQEVLEFYKTYSNYLGITGNILAEKNKYSYGIVTHTYEAMTGELQEDMSKATGNRNNHAEYIKYMYHFQFSTHNTLIN